MCRAIGRHGAETRRPRAGDPDPLQRRWPGHRRLRHGPGGDLRRARAGQAPARLRRRDASAAPGRPADRLGAEQRGIPVTLICDSMAAQVMREGKVQVVVVGADRIAANGDTANKIGTYGVALLAKAHGIPFYVAAPSSTFDRTLADGDVDPDRAARPARGHSRIRPTDRARWRGRLQPRLRRHPRRADRRHHHRAGHHPAGQRRDHPRGVQNPPVELNAPQSDSSRRIPGARLRLPFWQMGSFAGFRCRKVLPIPTPGDRVGCMTSRTRSPGGGCESNCQRAGPTESAIWSMSRDFANANDARFFFPPARFHECDATESRD